ncbi:MAG: TetR/AcrR family transcriptional regulator [Micropruina sp.]|nr:MAG: TetR/AcrR family transcriptional regulator [Micropruina sp.]
MVVSGRTRRRIEDTRARIVERTWHLLATRPWAEVTVADICEAADVAPRTFHRYFADKAELLFSESERHEDALRASLAAHRLVPEDPTPYLSAVLEDMVDQVAPYGAAGIAFRQQQLLANPDLRSRDLLKRERLADLAVDALRRGGVDPLRARVLAGAALQAFFGALAAWTEDGGELRALVADATGLLWGRA